MKEEKKDKVNEPYVAYGDKIHISSSFQEAEEYDIMQVLKQEPVQRIRETVELILRMYNFTREELNKRTPLNKITVKYYDK